jgi:ketosteroid isomerase-like protein
MRRLLFSLLIAVLAVPTLADSSGTADSDSLVQKYLAAVNAPDPVALAALYADDALVLPPQGGSIRGREAIKSFWTRRDRRGLSFEILRKNVCGEAGFYVGKFATRESLNHVLPAERLSLAVNRPRGDVRGNFVLCLRRSEKGSWQIASDLWNEDLQIGFVPAARPKP